MKKDRNCGMYPVYQVGGMPMPMPMPYMNTMGSMPQTNSGYTSSEINTLSNQINSLEQRVSNLENIVAKNYSTTYNSSNYQMM